MPARLSALMSGRSSSRQAALAAVLDPGRLPTPPAVALQVVCAASRPDCDPDEIVSLLALDPALCAKLLKAVNSCLYGLSRPVSSISRAVTILGLNTVRSLALGLSLPAVRVGGCSDEGLREYWVSAVAGGMFARELAVRTRRPAPDDDLIAGLLQDFGAILLRRAFPDDWSGSLAADPERLLTHPCEFESEAFGVTHAEATAELLRGWNLPAEIVEPIRHHHQPERLARSDRVMADRARLLNFVEHLTHLDVVAQYPDVLHRVLATAEREYDLPRADLIAFLEASAPKIEAFAGLLTQDVGTRPDFAAILTVGTEELVKLTVATSRDRLSGATPVAAIHRVVPSGSRSTTAPGAPTPAPAGTLWDGGADIPAFSPAFVEHLPASGCRLGEYELRQQIGRGAMGVVFRAYEPALDRFVAVKILSPAVAACETARRRFAREARVAAAIQHENVVAIHAVRETAGVAYLAMEYVRGECLEDRVEQNGPLGLAVLVSVARQIASGLAAAHARHIVHRDIKPANLLLESDTGRVKITDFGLARVVDDRNLTREGAIVGTPFFMAPEIVQGEPATTASDLFSLGAVLYALSTGGPPFAGQNVAAVLHGVCAKDPVPPRRLRPDLPGWLEDVILRLLQKDPARRFVSAADVAAVLSEQAGG